MKRLFCLVLTLALLALAGCSGIERELPEIPVELPELSALGSGTAAQEEGEKDYYLEITTPEGESLGIIPRGEVLDSILDGAFGEMTLAGERPQGLEPEYLCLLLQQKTLLAGQDPGAERDYEVVLRAATFRGSDYVEAEIPPEIAGLRGFPQELTEQLLTFFCRAPEGSLEALREAVG